MGFGSSVVIIVTTTQSIKFYYNPREVLFPKKMTQHLKKKNFFVSTGPACSVYNPFCDALPEADRGDGTRQELSYGIPNESGTTTSAFFIVCSLN
jgi:hypothetical protein